MISLKDKETAKDFLNTCRREIAKGNCIFIGYRTINIKGKNIPAKQALLDIGIMNKKQLWQHILELTEDECIDISFERDKNRDTNSEMFEFIKKINNFNVYIKLTINERGVVCLSFHESN